ncbi:MAG: hypothetical protein ACR2N4_05260 [Jatrophihabitans sp.]
MVDNGWFEGSNSPGAGDLGQMQALQQNLATTADAARHARTDLSGLKDQVSDAVWRGRPAEEFKDNIDSKFLGELDQLDTSYQDAADGFQTYISAVSDIRRRADSLAGKIYSAQQHYDSSATALQSWLSANPSSGSYSHGTLSAPSINAGAPYTLIYPAAPAPAGASASPGAADAAAATAASAQHTHSTLQATVNDAYSGLQALYRQMDGLKTHDRVAADNAVVGRINKAGKAGMHNESGWHKFFHALSTIAKWVGVALLVVAVVAVLVCLPGIGELGLMGALAAATEIGGAVVTIGGASISLASVAIYGGAIVSGAALIGDLGQRATGDGPGWGKVGLDVLGMVPGLGKAGQLLSRLGGPTEGLVDALDSGIVTGKLSTVYKIENLFDKIEYTPLGVRFAGITGTAEKGIDAMDNAILGYGEISPVTSGFGAAKWSLLKINGLWGGASNIFPSISKAALAEAGKAQYAATTQDLSAAQAQSQIQQYQQAHPAQAASAHQIAANLAKGARATVSFPRQHSYPQTVPVH